MNWEKYHFMVPEGVVFSHKIFAQGVYVDCPKTEVIEKLLPHLWLKAVRRHARFYRRFVKDLSKITKPSCNLFEKEIPFKLMRSA